MEFHPTVHSLDKLDTLLNKLDISTSTDTSHPQPDFCPEKYTDSNYGYPFYTRGWILTDCGEKSDVGKLITILVNPISSVNCSYYISRVLAGIKEKYSTVNVVIADRYSECRIEGKNSTGTSTQNFNFVPFEMNATDGKVWNSLIAKVKTKYLCIARGVDHFTWFSRLERQISAFSVDERVKIVGGSTRNVTGHWQMGCYQSQMKNYILDYKVGYRVSMNECAFCDLLLGPFVALTNFVQKVRFDENLRREVLFEDFFLRCGATGDLVLNCPDAMYFSTDPDHLTSTGPVTQKCGIRSDTVA